jgi:hypothetical protein
MYMDKEAVDSGNRLAKERALVSFLIAKQEIDPSNQIEKEKNTRKNPG